jgi:hypothetical protein
VKDGVEREPLARKALAEFLKRPVILAEFVFFQDRRFGCSPDGYVDDNPVEIKCPQIPGLLADLLTQPEDHWPQLQGHMLVTGMNLVHFWSWNPYTPSAYFAVRRSEAFCNTLHYELSKFCDEIDRDEVRVREQGEFDVKAFRDRIGEGE